MKLTTILRNLGNAAFYYPTLAQATGGVTATVLFSYVLQRQSALNTADNWVIITIDEIAAATGLSAIEQELARKLLGERSLLKERVSKGNHHQLELWLDMAVFEQRLTQFWPDNSQINSPIKQEINNLLSANNGHGNNPINIQVEQGSPKINQPIKSDKFFPLQRQPIAVKVTPNYQFSGPWNSQEQFEEFQAALLEYFKHKGDKNPAEAVFWTIDSISKGIVSPYWDEFINGMALGESQKVKRDWEIEPGVAYPAFEEEIVQYYVHKGEPLEIAVSKARSDLRNPVIAKDLWDGFLRKCDRVADAAIKAKNLGVTTPYLPPSFTDKPQITKESVINKLTAVAPQFSLASSGVEDLTNLSLEQQQVNETDIPSLASLQQAYKTPMGKNLVAQQIAAHPEWGYGIVDGEVVDLFPF